MTLESLGISQGLLILALLILAFILMMLFIFIILGIEAFALGGAFGAIINSIIPIGKYFLLFFKLLFLNNINSCWVRLYTI